MGNKRAIHYCGAVVVKLGKRSMTCCAGWPICCSGSTAYAIGQRGNQTYDRASVTCRRCLRLLDASEESEAGDG